MQESVTSMLKCIPVCTQCSGAPSYNHISVLHLCVSCDHLKSATTLPIASPSRVRPVNAGTSDQDKRKETQGHRSRSSDYRHARSRSLHRRRKHSPSSGWSHSRERSIGSGNHGRRNGKICEDDDRCGRKAATGKRALVPTKTIDRFW